MFIEGRRAWASSVGNFCILPHMHHHLERQWIGKLYDEDYSTSSLRGTEHAFSFNFILCRELVMTLTYLRKKGMLLVGSLLAQGVCCASTQVPLKSSVLPIKMAA